MIQNYNPGLHIIATLAADTAPLTNMPACKAFFDQIISEINLHKVGEVYHEFDNGSFTAVICLTESHISIHTWPEHGLATFDVFLSNYKEDNSNKARKLYQQTALFFKAREVNKQEVLR